MDLNAPSPGPILEKGQLWKLKRGYIYVVALLNSTIDLKLMNSPADKGARTLTSPAETLSRYILSRKGRLLEKAQTALAI